MLDACLGARAELVRSLEAEPAAACDEALRSELLAADAELLARAARIASQISGHVASLREIRSGVRGYRPETSQLARLISRSV